MTYSPPSARISVEAKLHWPNFSTSKKSPLLRWPSRFASPVETVAGSSVAATDVLARSSPTVIWPSVTVTVPRTLEMPACRTLKAASVCEGSMTQVPLVRPVGRTVLVAVVMRVLPRRGGRVARRSRASRSLNS